MIKRIILIVGLALGVRVVVSGAVAYAPTMTATAMTGDVSRARGEKLPLITCLVDHCCSPAGPPCHA
jgi:hypothetical protein